MAKKALYGAGFLVAIFAGCGGAPGGIDPALFQKYEQGNEKLGQVYYEQICTRCHKIELGYPVSPSEKTSFEWDELLAANHHGANQVAPLSSLDYFFSRDYRQSVISRVEVVRVYKDVSPGDLRQGVYKFVILGAKDSDMPHTCQ
jgi:hypothetical protein